jgi:ATP-binding protein involved in chromosome partitioning
MSHHEQLVAIGSGPEAQEEHRLRQRMARIRRRLVVLSGKGGVGKSTAAANLAVALSSRGHRVGLLDVDIHGPSIPKILGCEGAPLVTDGQSILPVEVRDRLTLMSIGFLIGSKTDAVIWRGPMKFKVIQQFLCDVAWGDLDYLVVDCPPGTGDEPLSVAQLIGRPAAAVVVTTPQELAVADVRRCITFCQKADLPIAGVLENMSGYVCPQCGIHTDLFGTGGGERLSVEMSVPFLGRIPIDPRIVGCGDAGSCLLDAHPESPAAQSYLTLAGRLHEQEDLWSGAAAAALTAREAPR